MVKKSGASMSWGGLDKGVTRLAAGLANKQELLDSCAEALLAGTLQRFENEEAPDGTAWEGIRREGKILSNKGRLRASIDKAVARDTIFIGSNLIYARIHQFGGIIKPKKGTRLRFKGANGKWCAPKEVTITARPYLGMSKEDWLEVRATITAFMTKAMRG